MEQLLKTLIFSSPVSAGRPRSLGNPEGTYLASGGHLSLPHWLCVYLLAKSCPTLFDYMDCSPPGSSVHEISQARMLGRVAIPSPGDLLNPGIEPTSPASLALQVNSSVCATWI